MRISSLMIILGCVFALLFPPGAWGTPSQLPLWSPLTSFEVRTLQRIDLARTGDADTLLALALMASGDIRHQKSYDIIRKRILQFTQSHQSEIRKETAIYAKGEKLLHAMHASFFASGGGQENELVEGYDSKQSQVSTIFKNGRFNCISSAILYMILARYADLRVEGVVTAHHAFIQILDENGRMIEVETTSKLGYGLAHDAEFYRKSFARFSLSRNLSMPTYEDYLKRRVLPPYRFIAENMNHQHTAKEHMKTPHRQRLYEIMGYLDSETPSSQLIRLNALSNACIRLLGQRSPAGTDRMFSVLDPVLRHVKSRPWIHQTQNSEVIKIQSRIGAIHLMQGHLQMKADRFTPAQRQYTMALKWARENSLQKQSQIGLLKSIGSEAFHKHQWEAAVQAYQKLLPLFDVSNRKQAAATRENIAAAYWNWANTDGNRGDWEKAATRYAAAAHWTRDRITSGNARSAKTKADAMHHLQLGDWEQAIQKFKAVLPLLEEANRKGVRSNIGTAYVNWGNDLFHRQAYGEALDKYEAALDISKRDNRALVIRNIAAAYHNLTVPHLKTKRLKQAVAILQSGVNRFPDCTPCREELRDLNRQLKAFTSQ